MFIIDIDSIGSCLLLLFSSGSDAIEIADMVWCDVIWYAMIPNSLSDMIQVGVYSIDRRLNGNCQLY